MRKHNWLYCISSIFFLFHYNLCEEYTPIVVWHGMGDWCNPVTVVGRQVSRLRKSLPGTYVLCLEIGPSSVEQYAAAHLVHPDLQIAQACKIIQNDPKLKNGYNAIGYSQGGQLIRGLVERCPYPKAKNVISVGGQQQGFYGIPYCTANKFLLCDLWRKSVNLYAYSHWAQNYMIQNAYWHNPYDEEKYRKGNTFIADINNENEINENYKERIESLENFVLVKFTKDNVVQPMDTQWFGYYKPGQSKKQMTVFETRLYKEDRIGLKYLYENGKLHFISVPTDHLQYGWRWYEEYIINPFLKN